MGKKTVIDTGVRSRAKVPATDFCYQMEWKGYLVNDPDYFTWSHFGLQGPDGKFHLFGERVPSDAIRTNKAHIAWALCKIAEIVHYTADHPEGPYAFADVPLKRGTLDEFDASMIYPTVHRDGNRWVMMYNGIASSGFAPVSEVPVEKPYTPEGDAHFWKGGLAVADSLDGPWRKVGVVLEPPDDPNHFAYKAAIHVPSLIPFRGKWMAYFHTGPGKPDSYGLPYWGPDGQDCIGVAVADCPEGPWRIMDQPAFQQPHPGEKGRHVTVEDVGVFVWNDRVHLLCTDFFGHVTGVVGGIALFTSDDGLSFPFEQARLAVDLIPAYYKAYDPNRIKLWWEPTLPNRFEAPRVMMIDGRPAYFLAGSGTNVEGGSNTASYLMKIHGA
jgi:hypothetical protein